MTTWFRILLSLSLSGGVLAVFLLGAARLLGRRLGQTWQYYIWLLVVFRMVLPVAAPVNLTGAFMNVYGAGIVKNISSDQALKVPEEEPDGLAAAPSQMGNEILTQGDGTEPASRNTGPSGRPTSSVKVWQLASVLWMAAAAGLLIRKIYSYGRAVRLLRTDCTDPEIFLAPFESACDACGLRRKPRLFVSRAVPVPVAFGILHPAVAVPADFPQDKAYYAFMHELTHIKRWDALYKWVVELVACLHFFNPMVYVLRRETARTCELSCDEAVMRKLTGQDRRAYGDMLLATLRHGMTPVYAAMTLHLGENAKWMKERLGEIMKFQKKSRVSMILASAITVLLSAGALLCGFAPVQESGSADHTESKVGSMAHTENQIDWDSEEILRRSGQKGYQATVFWENGYIAALAWNVDSSRYGTVRQIGGKPVSYTKKTSRYADDAAVTEVIRLAIAEREGKDGFQGRFPVEEPVLVGVDGPFKGTPDDLAPQFYEDGNIEYFSAVISKAETKIAQSIAGKAVKEDKTDFFAVAVDVLPDSTLSQYAETAYNENNLDIFAISAERLAEKEKRDLAKRAVKDGKNDYFAIVMDSLTEAELADLAFDSYDSDDIDIFYMVCDKINAETAYEIAKRAYEDDRVEYMYAVTEKMTEAQRTELKQRAKQDGKTEIWYALTDW